MRLSAHRGLGTLAAVGVGALPALAFPAPGLWWLAFCGLVPWLLLLRSAATAGRAAYYGWVGGTAWTLATHHWLFPNLHVFLLVLSALIGGLWAGWGWLAHRLLRPPVPSRARSLTALAVLPSGWLLAELVRSWEYLGGPWGLLGASQWETRPALRLMSVGGVWLVSLLLVWINVALVLFVVSLSHRLDTRGPRIDRQSGSGRGGGAVGAGALLLAVATLAGGAWYAQPPRTSGTADIAVVQPGVVSGAQARFDRSVELTRQLPDRSVDLVVWGESSVGFDPTARPDLARALRATSTERDSPLLVNVDARRPGGTGIFKSSVLVDERGLTGDRYDKMRLVPFGEYVPARSVLGWVTSVGRAADQDRMRGTEQRLMEASGLRIGPLICFETAFTDLGRHLVRDGAQVLVAQSSTSTFQDSWAPAQHASLAALRAAENGRPVVHAALTGVSAVFGPAGEPVGPVLGRDRSAAHTYAVPLAEGQTPYVRYGDWAVYLALATLAGYALTTLVTRRQGVRR